jgi:hypothetical protein
MKKLLIVIATVMGIAVCQTANATPILINGPFGVVILPANPTHELAELTAAITAYNAAYNPDVPPAGDIDFTPQLIGGATTDGGGHAVPPPPTPKFITIDFGVERETYAGLTWDGPQGGTLFYYVGNETGPVLFESPYFPDTEGKLAPRQFGLSHYMFTGAVPDGGTTVALLGLALVGLGVVRRRVS